MNFFVIAMGVFAFLGLFDKMLNGKMGLQGDFDLGLAKMGDLVVPVAGIYCVGVALMSRLALEIASLTQALPVDPSVFIGCLLASDLGGFAISQGIAGSAATALFSGVIVASCLGQLVGFQLPAMFSTVGREEKSNLMQGFILGMGAVPAGILVGGLLLGLTLPQLLLNGGFVVAICILLIVLFLVRPAKTERALMVLGEIIRVGGLLLFVVVAVGLFVPQFALVEQELIAEVLVIVLKMILIVCGGMVAVNLCRRFFRRQLCAVAARLGTNDAAVMGLMLNSINSLAMAPLLPQMDAAGQRLNGAFGVSGAFMFGGQMAFIASVADGRVFLAYMVSKLTAGALALTICLLKNKKACDKAC